VQRLLLALALTGTATATPVNVTIDPGPGQRIAPLAMGGFNISWDMPIVEALGAVRSVRVTSIRYPGGNVGDENDLTDYALLNLAANLKLVGPGTASVVQTRVFATRTDARNRPEDAAQAARDAKAAGINVTYWEIGNEPDLYARNRGDASWTPERYCQVFRDHRAAILKVDPTARFAGPATSNGAGPARAFLEAFVRACGDVVDLLTWHEYPTDGTAPDDAALASALNITQHAEHYRALLKDPDRNPLGYTRNIQYGVTEYGLSYRTNRPRHLADQVAALWAAEATLRLAETGASLAQYFAIVGAGNHGLVDLAGFPRPTLYAFQQIKHFQGTARRATTSDAAVWAHAAENGNILTLLVTNTAVTPRDLHTVQDGYTLIGGKTFTEQTVKDEADFTHLKLAPTATLPPRSLTRLVYKRLQ